MPLAYDPFEPEFRVDPYPWYRELRERAPVHRAPGSGVYCISRYDDVLAVLKSPDVFSSRAMFTMLMNNGNDGPPPLDRRLLGFLFRLVVKVRMSPFGFDKARNLISEDGSVHSAMRAIVNRGFTPRRIAAWEKRSREIVEDCLSDLERLEAFDVVDKLAIPLPVTVIAEMLGVEPERRHDFKRWSDAVIENATGPGRAEPFNRAFVDAILELFAYLKRVTEERRRQPSDDLISVIAAAEDGEAALSVREIVQFVNLLLVAGNETTTNLIGNGVDALLDRPDEIARAAADPGRVPAVLEETLRFDAPIQLVFRKVTRDVEIAGTPISEGAVVAPLLGSANRDERRFPDPDHFDPDRDTAGHLGFGFGKHFCLGSSLARLEAKVALEALLPALGRFERARPGRELVDSFLVRGPRRLELKAA